MKGEMIVGRGRGIVSRGVKGEDLREGSGFRREDGPRRPSSRFPWRCGGLSSE